MESDRHERHADIIRGGGVIMNEVIAQALAESVSKGNMTIEQVPIPYRDRVREKIEEE